MQGRALGGERVAEGAVAVRPLVLGQREDRLVVWEEATSSRDL